MKSTSPLSWIQQAGAPETAAESATPCLTSVSDCKRLDRSLPSIANFRTGLKPQVNISQDMNSPAFTQYTFIKYTTYTALIRFD